MEKNHNESPLTLGDLPESCLSKVLQRTTPKDVCRLSVVCRSFKSAGNSNYVWEKMLPPRYRDLLDLERENGKQSSGNKSSEELQRSQSFQKFWLDKATGKLCFILSARELGIVWGSNVDNEFWHWNPQDESSIFEEVAELIKVCWFEVEGNFDSKLVSPGIAYTVSFRLKLNGSASNHRWNDGRMIHAFHTNGRAAYGWNQPVKFRFRTPWGHQQLSTRFLQNTENLIDIEGYQMASFRHVGGGLDGV